jgi:hypothetical protein
MLDMCCSIHLRFDDIAQDCLVIRCSKFRSYAASLTMFNLYVAGRKYKGNERNLIGIV